VFRKLCFVIIGLLIICELFSVQFLLQKGTLLREERVVQIAVVSINNAQLIFELVPQGWNLPKNMKDIVSENLFLEQYNKKISPQEIRISNDKVLINFSAADLDIYQEFQFANSEAVQQFRIPEEFWPRYEELSSSYQKAQSHIENKNKTAAVSELSVFLNDDQTIKHFSFTPKAKAKVSELISEFIAAKERFLEIHKLKTTRTLTAENLIEIDSLKTVMLVAGAAFESFFSYTEDEMLGKNYQKLCEDIEQYNMQLNERYYTESMEFLTSDYTNNYFSFMLDALVKTLCYKDSFCLISSYLDFGDDFLNAYPKIREKLQMLEWEDDYYRLVQAVKSNIADKNYILNSEYMTNLETLSSQAPQPYWQVISALSAILQCDWDTFNIHLTEAIYGCSDQKLLQMLESLQLAYSSELELQLSDKIVSEINLGIRLMNERKFAEARLSFEKVRNWQSGFALPDYYLGLISLQTNDIQKAEIYFESAINKQPIFKLPTYKKISLLTENSDFSTAINLINRNMTTDYWYKFFLLGKLQLLDGKPAKENLIKAWNINSHSFDLMIYLGDVYKINKNREKAKEYYKLAGAMEPENEIFIQRLRELDI
jgi:hypothetical protein